MQTKRGCGCGSKPMASAAGGSGPQDIREFLERRPRVVARHASPASPRTIDEIVAQSFDSDRPNTSKAENIRAPGPNGTALPPLY